jgi:hypothetical protein
VINFGARSLGQVRPETNLLPFIHWLDVVVSAFDVAIEPKADIIATDANRRE